MINFPSFGDTLGKFGSKNALFLENMKEPGQKSLSSDVIFNNLFIQLVKRLADLTGKNVLFLENVRDP